MAPWDVINATKSHLAVPWIQNRVGLCLEAPCPIDKVLVPTRPNLEATTLLNMLKTLLMALKTLEMVLKPLQTMEKP